MKIVIGADHLGITLKNELISYLKENGFDILELDTQNSELDDYPDFAFELGKKVIDNDTIGILVCGNGIGMSIAANKVKGIRAARVTNKDDAFKAKNHNGANVITIGANLLLDDVKDIVDTFIATKNPNEERYLRRITKISNYETENK